MAARLAATLPVILLISTAGAAPIWTASQQSSAAVTPLASPAGAESGQPQLTVSNRGVLLSWIERAGTMSTLRFAERSATGWTEATTVASGSDWFVNWADVPSVLRLDDGTIAAHWLQKSGAGTYAYDVRLSYSRDNGRTWATAVTPHHDGTQTEHGFASLLQMPGSGLGLFWLDGRATSGGHGGHGGGAMSLRFGAFDQTWKQTADAAIDQRVCDCCPTAAAVTADGPVVVYRDRSDTDVRDIAIARFERGGWTAPARVHPDNWTIQACPVNGPAIAARGRHVVVAWFTAVGERPRTYLAFSRDAGRSFGTPAALDDGVAIGRVDVELLPDGSAVAAYIEQTGQRSQFRVRRVDPGGVRSPAIVVAGLDAGRTSGYPRIAVHQGEITAAWVERQGSLRVKTARLKM